MMAHPLTPASGGHHGGDEEAPGRAPLVLEGEGWEAEAEDEEDAEAEAAAAAVVYAYQRGDGRRHDLDPIPPEERTWTTWSFLSL